MSLGAFAESRPLSLGVELELQLVNTHDYDLVGGAGDLLREVARQALPGEVKPEMTDSMIEMSTGVCENFQEVLGQLSTISDALLDAAGRLNIGVCGGGTHGFQRWDERKIFDKPRFNHLSELYGYLAKQFTIFGQHVHIGCPCPDGALYLAHSLSRYIPHFIALSASSPFVQGADTGFQSARLNSVFAFPLSGRLPFVESWAEFDAFFQKMTATGVVQSMKDFYWDIRPKPEYGTIEVRVMDTPLSVHRAAEIAAYIQAVSRWLMIERPLLPQEDDYLVYAFNRFQACRFGLAGTYVDPRTHEQCTITEHVLATLDSVEPHAIELGSDGACDAMRDVASSGVNDATVLREEYANANSLNEVVRRQCLFWKN
jgi:carboxylate-amine ligase